MIVILTATASIDSLRATGFFVCLFFFLLHIYSHTATKVTKERDIDSIILFPSMASFITLILPHPSESLDCRCMTFFQPVVFVFLNEYEYFTCMHVYALCEYLVFIVVKRWSQKP